MPPVITIEVSKEDSKIVEELNTNGVISSRFITSSFDGDIDVISIVVELAKHSIPFIVNAVMKRINENKKVKIIYKGTVIKDISEEKLRKISEILSDKAK